MTVKDYLDKIESVIKNGKYKDNWASLSGHPVPKWYSDAKFGIFIHWGVYSVPAFSYEWYPRHMYIKGTKEHAHHIEKYGTPDAFGYKDFIPLFKAEKFNADEWLQLFKESGAKYIMPVAEHHDGFQMYDSDFSKWNTVNMGPERDVLGELKEASEKRNITFCTSSHRAEHYWYFNGGRGYKSDINDSKFSDFYGPAVYDEHLSDPFPRESHIIDSTPPSKEYMEDWLARTCEIIDKYQPQSIYFDWWIQNIAFKPYLKKFAAYYYNRALEWGKEVTINYKYNAFAYTSAVYDVERGQLSGISPRLWQNDTSISKHSWGYTDENDFKNPVDIVSDLIDVVSKNGCLLLNVGPKADGTITDEEQKVLRSIGKWMRINGEGIYGTTFWKVFGEGPTVIPEGHFSDTKRSPFTSQDIRYTYKDGVLYAFILRCPENGKVELKSLSCPENMEDDLTVGQIDLLGSDGKVNFERTKKSMSVSLPDGFYCEYPICLKIVID